MRINPDSTSTTLSSLNSALRSEREGLLRLSSGKRIQTPSDDPAASALLVHNAASSSANAEFTNNGKNLEGQLRTADSALSSATSLLIRAISLGVEGSNGTQSTENRVAIAREVRGIRDQLFSLANTTYRGSYVFAGTASNQAPFLQLADGSIQYQGNNETNYARIGENRTIATNIPGDRLFDAGPASVFAAFNSLLKSLEANDPTSVAAATSNVRQSFDKLTSERVFYGNAISHLEANTAQLGDERLQIAEDEERLAGADLAETVSQITQAQTAIQAVLTASGKISRQSLLDFLQ